MRTRLWSTVAAVLLLGSVAVAFTTSVTGETFEHQADVTDDGSAYAIDWQDAEAGTVRLQFDPMDHAAEPTATVSLFSPEGELMGTHGLDAEWRQLDLVLQDRGEHTLVVHQATGANLQILTEKDRAVHVGELELQRDRIELIDGQHQDLAYQVALDREADLVSMGLIFEGQASGLDVQVLGEEDQLLLEGQRASIEAAGGQVLSTASAPAIFDQVHLLVRLQATSLDGTVSLEIASLPDKAPQPLQVTPAHEEDQQANASEEDPADEETNTTAKAPPINGTAITEIEPRTPVAFTVPEGVTSVYLIAQEGRGVATVFGTEDTVLESLRVEEDNGVAWDEANRTVAVELPVNGTGEHVILLTDTHEAGTLLVPGIEEASLVEHRTLETAEETVRFESNSTLLAQQSSASQVANVTGGLVGFSWTTDGVDVDRSLRLVDPAGETVYESQGLAGGDGFRVIWHSEGGDPIIGPSGSWTVETSGSSVFGGSVEATLVHYVR